MEVETQTLRAMNSPSSQASGIHPGRLKTLNPQPLRTKFKGLWFRNFNRDSRSIGYSIILTPILGVDLVLQVSLVSKGYGNHHCHPMHGA